MNNIFDSLRKLINTMEFFVKLLLRENFCNFLKIKDSRIKTVYSEVIILANGPSLKEVIVEIRAKEEFKNKDFCAVNYIANDAIYENIKPLYYVLSDHQFFLDNHEKSAQGKELICNINQKTTWEMDLFIPFYLKRKGNWRKLITNPQINIVTFHSPRYNGFEFLRFPLYKHGLGNGQFGTVVLNAEYAMIQRGYKKIHLYGVDHNFFDGMRTNSKNRFCIKYPHYYDKNQLVTKPMSTGEGVPMSVADFLEFYYVLFRGHEIINNYSKYMGVKIINHTKNSLIDSYERIDN